MKVDIVCISDTHGREELVTLPPGDLLLHAGDWGARGNEPHAIGFLQWFESQPHPNKAFIAGNHSFFSENKKSQFAHLVGEYAPSCHYLCDSGVTLCGLRIWGSPVQPRFLDWAWNRDRGAAIKAHWDLIPLDTQVLITHGPPHGILDDVRGERASQGCRDLLDAVKRLPELRLHVFGHLHLSGGCRVIEGSATFVNAAMVDEDYELTRQAQVITIET